MTGSVDTASSAGRGPSQSSTGIPPNTYSPSAIELKWQRAWADAGLFATPAHDPDLDDAYVRVAPPFTTGDVHMGHARSYSIADAHARFRRARGDSVLFALGFDAFGLPAELGAIERDMRPAEWVIHCCRKMQEQFDRLGFSFDSARRSLASDPDTYRWSQWLFLEFLDAGLVYQREGYVDWCDSCRTVLADSQVEDGCCWRCHGATRFEQRTQWYLRLSAYNEENERRLDELHGWNPVSVSAQRTFLGRTDGVEFEAHTMAGETLTVFTPFPDEIGKAKFVAMSPRYADVGRWLDDEKARELAALSAKLPPGDHSSNQAVVTTEHSVYVSGVAEPLPIVVSPGVDERYGPTVALGIPSVDRTDHALAQRIAKPAGSGLQIKRKPLPKRAAVRYRASDFAISRQRAWGTPIPVIHCAACGAVPVPVQDLPVVLPDDLIVTGQGNVLDEHPTFADAQCPSCGGDGRRETDTLDCHMDVAWHTMSVAVPPEDKGTSLFDHPELSRWFPISVTVHGADIGGFVLTQRMTIKALRDLGHLSFLADGELYTSAQMHQMVLSNGHKMSKHLGNTISPGSIIDDFGADALRLTVLHAAAPSKTLSWDENVLRHSSRFLARVWAYSVPRLCERPAPDGEATIEVSTSHRRRLSLWCQTAVERMTDNYASLDTHRATRNLMTLFARIEDFENRVLDGREELSSSDMNASAIALLLLVQLMAPVTPHIAEELWEGAGREGFVSQAPWPTTARSPDVLNGPANRPLQRR